MGRKTFLVVLELQGCLCKALEEVDKALYGHARGKNKGYVYDTLQLHDRCYMVIKVSSEDDDHEQWLKEALDYSQENKYEAINIINLTHKKKCGKRQESEKVFLVALKPQSHASKTLDEIDKQLYGHVVGKDKCYAYNTMELHDRCYIVIKILSTNADDHEEWLREALNQPEDKDEEVVQEEVGNQAESEDNKQNEGRISNNIKKYKVANIFNLTDREQCQ